MEKRRLFYTEEELLKDLRRVAELLEQESVSKNEYCTHGNAGVNTFRRRFGSWSLAVAAAGLKPYWPCKQSKKVDGKVRPKLSTWMRYKILRRDRFRCVLCGRSPSKNPDVELHVDHIKAVANGGDSTESNLQTLCSLCNLGKGARDG